MNIRSLLGLETASDKLRKYRSAVRKSYEYKDKGNELAKSFSEMSALKSMFMEKGEMDEDMKDAMNRYDDFIKEQGIKVSDLRGLVIKNESVMKSISSDKDLSIAIKEIDKAEKMRYLYQKKQITKSVYFDFLKSKGAVKYADVIVQKFTPDGIKILILNCCTDMGEATDDWCIPGGHVDEGEEFKVAARRELWEETGIEVAADRLREVATYKNNDADIHYYMVTLDEKEGASILLDSEEEVGSAWIKLDKIDNYNFIFDMKENLKRIMGLDDSCGITRILKAYSEGYISKSVFDTYCKEHPDEVLKAQNKTYFSHSERKDLAKKGEAMPNGKYPIRNEQDLHDAIRLVGASDMPKSEVKAWIRKRAKELGLTDKLPESWGEKKEGKVEKSENETGVEEKAMTTADAGEIAPESLKEEVVGPQGSGVENGDDKVEKAISFKKRQYSEKYVEVDEKPIEDVYGQGSFSYSGVNSESAEKFFDMLGMIQKVSGRCADFSVKVITPDNGEQEWKFNHNCIYVNGLRRNEEINKSVENDVKKENDDIEKSEKTKKADFLSYINFLQGMITRKDNLHWTEEDNSKHVYLDEVGDLMNDFKDTLAESGQALFGRFDANTVESEEIEESDPLKFIKLLFERTTKFRKSLDGDEDYFGELSLIDDFLVKTKQSIYRLQLH